MAGVKKARLSKRTNHKQSFKKFVESGYLDIQAFLNGCRNDENMLIYTCLKRDELQQYINKMQEFETLDEQIKYLKNNQPAMNATLERFNKCTESIAKYLKGYIEFNGFKMANRCQSYEDWTSEFWAKYCKICEFYRTRWFFPEKLKKESSVVYSPILYKEFVYICRLSITGERKHLAFLATQDESSSIFNVSIDDLIEGNEGDKTLGDVISDEEHDIGYLTDTINTSKILEKAIEIAKNYPDAVKCLDKIKDFYEKQDPMGFDKRTIMLGRIFLYKAGLISPKTLAFVKSLSATFKARYHISNALIEAQMQEFVHKDGPKADKVKQIKKENATWRELVFRKRGEL